MTVGELMNRLAELDKDLPVTFAVGDRYRDLEHVLTGIGYRNPSTRTYTQFCSADHHVKTKFVGLNL